MAGKIHLKEMEETFELLYQEFRRLKSVCERQAEMIKKLTEKREMATERPFTLPIQCTDAGKPDQSEGPFLRPQKQKVLQVAACNVPTDSQGIMVDRKHGKELEYCSRLDIRFPPTRDESSFFISEPEKLADLNTVHQPEPPTPIDGSVNDSLSNLYDDCRCSYNFNVDRSSLEQPAMDISHHILGEGDIILKSNYLFQERQYSGNDLENVPEQRNLNSAVIYRSTDCVSVLPELSIPPEIAEPQQSSWSPHCLAEECCTGHEAMLSSESSLNSQVCEFCQAVFPAGAATRADYLVHLTGHIEFE
ncbi:TRAF family member-associated NF-kappa-B activator [Chiloscyllium plagiosum]|uniref:TRAF family member-associated NF-kappa-B activator n=1 Tax=Chiloscyllium plagiosum TaxID=36176 RepID=UPI001CB853BE|nr:TRAF family member-associated NF-kappa-B activator [Chiloscyllium plagiosum]